MTLRDKADIREQTAHIGHTEVGTMADGHTGPICKGCSQPFYYDYIQERHDGSGYCWLCFDGLPSFAGGVR